jgi:hypothetical protein
MAKKIKKWTEGELASTFVLQRDLTATMPLLVDWLDADTSLSTFEQMIFDKIVKQAAEQIGSWGEEDLKMNFIAFIIDLANLRTNEKFRTYYEKTVEATVENIFLKTKTDFMIAQGVLDFVKVPYFHFQEYKKDKDPNGDVAAQLLEAFLIAQALNQTNKPLYGTYVLGRLWYFVTMQDKKYAISKAYDSTDKGDLLQIIGILRKFKYILETELLD